MMDDTKPLSRSQRAMLERIVKGDGKLLTLSILGSGGGRRTLHALINMGYAMVADHPTVKIDRANDIPAEAIAPTEAGRLALADASRTPTQRKNAALFASLRGETAQPDAFATMVPWSMNRSPLGPSATPPQTQETPTAPTRKPATPYCPHCGSPADVRDCEQWEARSLNPSDRNNTCTLTEWQCMPCGRSFWTG